MFKRVLCILSLLIMLPVHAGVFDSAVKENEKVFLYFYTDKCSYCEKFAPTYEKIVQKYAKKCSFAKVDYKSDEGRVLAKTFMLYYVPDVILLDYKKQTLNRLEPSCIMDYACVKNAVDELVK